MFPAAAAVICTAPVWVWVGSFAVQIRILSSAIRLVPSLLAWARASHLASSCCWAPSWWGRAGVWARTEFWVLWMSVCALFLAVASSTHSHFLSFLLFLPVPIRKTPVSEWVAYRVDECFLERNYFVLDLGVEGIVALGFQLRPFK